MFLSSPPCRYDAYAASTAWLVDWAWPTLSAAWIDPACAAS